VVVFKWNNKTSVCVYNTGFFYQFKAHLQSTTGVVKNKGTSVLFPVVGGSQEKLLMAFGNDPVALEGLESK